MFKFLPFDEYLCGRRDVEQDFDFLSLEASVDGRPIIRDSSFLLKPDDSGI